MAAGRQIAPADLLSAWLDSGVRLIQLRAKHLSLGPMLETATAFQEQCSAAGALFIVNDRVDVALLAGASGVHVGQDDLSPVDVRRLASQAVIGLSTHYREQLESSLDVPADYVAIGPVFASKTKDGSTDPAVGLEGITMAARILRQSGLQPFQQGRPLVAIGGVTLESAPSLVGAGASSVAVISDLMKDDWRTRARRYLEVLDGTSEPV
jgi:thiamine-phosphate pyrophosphorylase